MTSSTPPWVAAPTAHNNVSLHHIQASAARFRALVVILAVAVVCSIVQLPRTSLAQTTWDNTGTEWTSGTSWVGDVAPSSSSSAVGNTAVFTNLAVGFNAVNLSSDRSIYGVLFTVGANAYTFTGGALTFNGAFGISNLSANVQTFSNKVILTSSSGTIGSYTAGGSLVLAGGIDLSATAVNRTMTLGGIGDITVSGAIANGGTATAANVTITNTALTIFSGNNTYGGTTTVQSGATLRLGSATALGTTNGATAVTGALDLNGQAIALESLSISGSGVSSSGVIFNSSSSAASWSGNITQTASSTIKATTGTISLSGGIDLAGNAASPRTLTLDGTGGIIVSGNISNSFAGSTGTLVIAATASNVTLSGSNSYNGTTTLTGGGAMNINSAYAISTNTFTIGTSAFLNNTSGGAITNLGNNNITLGDTLTFGTSGSTAANSLNLGTGTVTASGGRTITIAGTGVTLGLGTLDSTSTSSGRTFTANGAGNTLSLAGWNIQSGSTANVTATLSGSANWTITGPIVNGNAFSNGVQINATGLTTFGGNNSYDGTTIVSSGATLRITSATGLGSTNTGTTVSAGGQLQLSGGIAVDVGESLSLSGTNGDTASLRNISGANTYNGAITFTTGTNRIDSDAGTLTLSSFSSTVVSNRWLLVGGAGNTIFTGRVTGNNSGSLVKDGAGTLTLANTNNEVGPSGVVLINNGTLALGTNNALATARAVAVNGGTLDIGGYSNTVAAVTLTNGTITNGTLSGTSYAVENGTISAILGGSGVLTKSAAGTVTLSGANTYSGGTLVSAGVLSGDTTSLQGNITNDAVVIFTQSTNGTFASVLSGSGTLLKTNAGTLILTGANTQNGGTTIGQGTLQIGNGGSTGSLAGNITNNGTLAYNLTGTSTQSTVISGSGTVTKSGAGTVTLSGANSYNGGTLVSAGVLSGDTTSLQGNITNDATTAFSQTTNGTYAGTMSGSGALTKSGSGTVTLSAANSYDGATTVSAGALTISNGSALGSATGGTTVAAGSALQLQGGITINGETLGLSGTNGDTASLRNISGNNTYNGTITFTTGTNRFDSDAGTLVLRSFATGNALTSGRSLFVGGAGDTVFTGSLTGSSSATITKDGSGILTLSNTWVTTSTNGATVVADGTLRLGINQAITNILRVTGAGATLDLGAYNTAVGAVTLSNGTITGTTGVLTGSSYAVENGTISAILGGSGALTKTTAGTVTLSGANTFSGGITNSAGTLRAENSSALSSGAVQNAGTLEIAAAISKNNIANSGTVSVVAGGSLTANSLGAGSTGALTLSGSVGNRAVFTDTAIAGTTSAPTVLNVGSLSLGGNSTIALQNVYNTITASGAVNISNAGNLLSIAGIWASGSTYNLLTGSSLSASGISLTNALWGSSIALGASNTLGRTTYLFDTNATALFMTVSGQVGNITWNGAASGSWNYDELNTPWTNNADGTPSAFYIGDSVTLGTPDSTITVDAGGVTAGSMTVNNASGTVALSGGAITNTSFAKSGAGSATIANDMVSLGDMSMSAGGLTLNGTTTAAGSLALSGGTIAGAGTITASNGYALTNGSIAASLAGSGALTKAGADTVTLSGANTHSGTNTVSAGALRAASSTALGSTSAGTIVASGAALELSGGISVGAESLNLSGTGISTNGALRNISGDNSYGGLITLGAASRINSDAGTLTLTNIGTITGAGRDLSLGGSGNITLNSSIGTTTGTLTKDGTGTVTLNGINTYTGNTTLASGTLRINGTNSGGGTITINNSSSRLLLNTTNSLSATTSLSGASASTNTGTLDLGAAGNYTLNRYTGNNMNFTNSSDSSTTLTFTSSTNIITSSTDNSGARSLINNSADLDIVFSGAVDIGSTSATPNNITLGGTGDFVINGSVFNNGVGVRGLTKTGSGALTLAASNNYNGVTTISGGTLRISNSLALGTTDNGTTVAANAALELIGGITVGAESLDLSGTGISSGGALRNISGNNTYGGTITNTLASRINSDAGLLTLSGAINATNQALTFGGAGNIAVSGAITNSTSTLTKDGAGTLTLSGANTYSGGTVVSAGELAYGADNVLANSGAVTVSNATFNIGSYSDTVGAVVVTNGGRITGTTGILTGSSYASGVVGATNTISANLAGSGGLSLTGNTNTTVLSGSNSYSGDTTLQTSTSTNMRLRVTTTNALSSNSSLVGSSSAARIPTLELAAAGDYKMQNFKGGNMNFLATNGAATLSFTNTSVTNDMVGGDRSFYATNVDVSFAGALEVSATTADKEFRFFGDGDYTFNGSILTTNNTFTSSMLVGTTGTVTLNASNDYNGTTTVNSSATLLLGDDNALGTTNSGTTVVSGGALDLGGSAISDEALSVAGTGVSSGGAIKNSSASAASFSGAVTLTAATTIAATNGDIEISGAIGQDSGSRNLTKTGSSTLTLSGTSANTYLGRTTVNGGVLELNKTAGINAIAGAVSVGSGAKLLLSANNQVADTSLITLSGGTIQRASGVSEVFGDLDLTAPSFLNFGTGDIGTLSFGTYTPSSLLTVQSFLPGNTLTFGSDLTSTINNTSLFAFSGGFTSSWNGTDTFTITAIPEPSTYVAAVALLGLMLWPSRRRLLKGAKSILGFRAPAPDRLQVRSKA